MAALKTSTLLLGVVTACCACAGPVKDPGPANTGEPVSSVYLIGHGWHTGIAVKQADIPHHLWPERQDFSDAEYLEVGWGDREFYQAPRSSLALALKAAFASRGSVLHVIGFQGPVTRYFSGLEVIELKLSSHGRDRLVRYVHDTFAREGGSAAASLGPGFYRQSRFYPARGTFSLANTCNTWTAKALQAAGYSITPASTAEPVIAQARQLGQVIQSPPPDR